MKLRVLLTLTVLAGVLPVLATACGEEAPAPQPPPRLVIRKAKVDARIVTLSIDENGAMQSPPNAYDVAWYDFSARPGAGGNAVFSGYIDYHDVGPAVFWNLRDLQQGDVIEVYPEDGTLDLYSVSSLNCIPNSEAPIAQIVGPTPSEVATLITACGTWDSSAGEYDSHLVVRADRIFPPPSQPPPTVLPLPTAPPATATANTIQADTIWTYCQQVGNTSSSWSVVPELNRYRCYEGKLYRCEYWGQNYDPCNKLTSTQPLGLADYCTTHPNDLQPPRSVGLDAHTPVIWGCKDGMPISFPDPSYDPATYDDFGFYIPAWHSVP